jgi:hypothetical protein
MKIKTEKFEAKERKRKREREKERKREREKEREREMEESLLVSLPIMYCLSIDCCLFKGTSC